MDYFHAIHHSRLGVDATRVIYTEVNSFLPPLHFLLSYQPLSVNLFVSSNIKSSFSSHDLQRPSQINFEDADLIISDDFRYTSIPTIRMSLKRDADFLESVSQQDESDTSYSSSRAPKIPSSKRQRMSSLAGDVIDPDLVCNNEKARQCAQSPPPQHGSACPDPEASSESDSSSVRAWHNTL